LPSLGWRRWLDRQKVGRCENIRQRYYVRFTFDDERMEVSTGTGDPERSCAARRKIYADSGARHAQNLHERHVYLPRRRPDLPQARLPRTCSATTRSRPRTSTPAAIASPPKGTHHGKGRRQTAMRGSSRVTRPPLLVAAWHQCGSPAARGRCRHWSPCSSCPVMLRAWRCWARIGSCCGAIYFCCSAGVERMRWRPFELATLVNSVARKTR